MDDASGSGSDTETAAKQIRARPRQVQNPYRTQSNARVISPHVSRLWTRHSSFQLIRNNEKGRIRPEIDLLLILQSEYLEDERR
ncbi:MAG: hypothetical protein CL933_04650 [Deltaproteobacteria bacterium]|nr:hypothetical protein [Deltaproteobacteria bacterium]